jgi:hypothetical protein
MAFLSKQDEKKSPKRNNQNPGGIPTRKNLVFFEKERTNDK